MRENHDKRTLPLRPLPIIFLAVIAAARLPGCGGGGSAGDGNADETEAVDTDAGDTAENDAEAPPDTAADDVAPDGIEEDLPPDEAEPETPEDPSPDAQEDDASGDPDVLDDDDTLSFCDSDGDMYYSMLCGGNDCDDTRADIHPMAVEVCTDLVDNDCNGWADMADPFCNPDVCNTPTPTVDVSAGGSFRNALSEAADWDHAYRLWSCMLFGGLPAYQALFLLTLTEARDVHVTVTEGAPAAVGLVRGCDPAAALNLSCIEGGAGHGTFRNVEPGTYLLVAQHDQLPMDPPPTGDVAIDVTLSAPTPPPPNDTCTGAVDISAGGSFTGTLAGARVDYEAPMCSSRAFADVAYAFTLTQPSDVELVVDPGYNIVVARDCAALRMTHLACRSSWASFGSLPAGTYYVLVGTQSPTYDDAGPFTLDVRLRSPAEPMPGNTCADAVNVLPGETVAGDLFGGTNSMSAEPYPGSRCLSAMYDGETDAFFGFTLGAPRHVELVVTSDTLMHLTLFTSCADIAGTTVACNPAPWTGPTSVLRVRDLTAGDYLLRMQAGSFSPAPPGPYTLEVGIYAPDSTCLTPAGGIAGPGSTVLSGTTASSFDDHHGSCPSTSTDGRDVVYTLDLSARSRVILDTTGSPETTAYLRTTCESEASQVICADPTAAATLEPGRTFIIIDSLPGPYSVIVDRITL